MCIALLSACTVDEFTSLEVTTMQPEINSGEVTFNGEISGGSGAEYSFGFLVFDEVGNQRQITLGTGRGNTSFTTTVSDLPPNSSNIVCAFVQQESENSNERTVGDDIPFVFLP